MRRAGSCYCRLPCSILWAAAADRRIFQSRSSRGSRVSSVATAGWWKNDAEDGDIGTEICIKSYVSLMAYYIPQHRLRRYAGFRIGRSMSLTERHWDKTGSIVMRCVAPVPVLISAFCLTCLSPWHGLFLSLRLSNNTPGLSGWLLPSRPSGFAAR